MDQDAMTRTAPTATETDVGGLAAGKLKSFVERIERLDRAGCWTQPSLWPSRVIVMTLERVGSDGGPDLDTFAQVRRQAPQRQFIGAGGIRDARDLSAAREAGASAWLVASALHDLRLPAADR
jgi:phosphoribosylformimino-5-aminoimidazole carboxamide ribotide isomerase